MQPEASPGQFLGGFMKLSALHFSSLFGKTVFAALALGGILFAGAPAAKANSWEECHRRVNYTEMRYREAVERFGPYSREARHWAHERHEAYEHCRR
jgi:hypothetical protein